MIALNLKQALYGVMLMFCAGAAIVAIQVQPDPKPQPAVETDWNPCMSFSDPEIKQDCYDGTCRTDYDTANPTADYIACRDFSETYRGR